VGDSAQASGHCQLPSANLRAASRRRYERTECAAVHLVHCGVGGANDWHGPSKWSSCLTTWSSRLTYMSNCHHD
jgi:hypothetical protein